MPTSQSAGRPREVYTAAAELLEAVQNGFVRAEDVLAKALALLLAMRDEQDRELSASLAKLQSGQRRLSTEDILTLLDQHLKSRNASRLPVILVAALYQTLGVLAGEQALSLGAHNAADARTGALGDVEVVLRDAKSEIVTVYEIKARAVSVLDIQAAVQKVLKGVQQPENYLFVTTQPIDREVAEYARQLHAEMGTEFAVLDTLSFARHLLHFFHRHRFEFLDAYQQLLLAEPASAVRPELKIAWLALRQAAES